MESEEYIPLSPEQQQLLRTFCSIPKSELDTSMNMLLEHKDWLLTIHTAEASNFRVFQLLQVNTLCALSISWLSGYL